MYRTNRGVKSSDQNFLSDSSSLTPIETSRMEDSVEH